MAVWSDKYAPATTVSPETDTDWPNLSPAAPSEARSFCSWVQVVPERTNTYAEPVPPLTKLVGAPSTTVFPDTDTEVPNHSSGAPSEAVSFCCWVQVVPERTNT